MTNYRWPRADVYAGRLAAVHGLARDIMKSITRQHFLSVQSSSCTAHRRPVAFRPRLANCSFAWDPVVETRSASTYTNEFTRSLYVKLLIRRDVPLRRRQGLG